MYEMTSRGELREALEADGGYYMDSSHIYPKQNAWQRFASVNYSVCYIDDEDKEATFYKRDDRLARIFKDLGWRVMLR